MRWRGSSARSRHLRVRGVLVLALLFLPLLMRASVRAAELPVWAAEPLLLPRCIELALRDVPTVQQQRARLQAAEATEVLARTIPNPVFSYTAQDLGLVTPNGSALLHQQALSFPILFAYTRRKEAQAARAARAQAGALVEEEQRQIRRSVARSYFAAALALRLQQIEVRALQLAAALVTQAERRVQHGDAGPIEIARAQAEVLEAQRSAELSQRRSDQARLSLSTLLGAEQPFLVQLPEAALALQGLETLSAEQGGVPLSARPDLRAAHAALERAHAQRELEARRQVPLADLQLVAGARESTAGAGGLLALSVPVPLFDHNAGPLQLARAQVEAARAALTLSTRQVALEFRRTEREWEGARDSLSQTARPAVLLRERALEAAQRQFAEGLVPMIEVVSAQRDLLAAERTRALAEHDAALAAWEYRLARAAD